MYYDQQSVSNHSKLDNPPQKRRKQELELALDFCSLMADSYRLSRNLFGYHEISPCATLSRDDKGGWRDDNGIYSKA